MAPKVFQSVSNCWSFSEVFLEFFNYFHIFFFSFVALLITQQREVIKQLNAACTNVYKQYTAWDPVADGLSQGVRYRRDSSTRCVVMCADVLITFCRVWLLLLIKLTKATWNFTRNTHKQDTLHADEPKEHAAETESKISLKIEASLGSEVRCAKCDVRRATIERRLRRVWLCARQYE